jgi:hypothetical protein
MYLHGFIIQFRRENMYGYGGMMPPYCSPREFIKAMRDMEDWEEVKELKKKKNEKKDPKKKGLTGVEVFLCLTLLSPLIGPLYLAFVISAAHKIAEMLH